MAQALRLPDTKARVDFAAPDGMDSVRPEARADLTFLVSAPGGAGVGFGLGYRSRDAVGSGQGCWAAGNVPQLGRRARGERTWLKTGRCVRFRMGVSDAVTCCVLCFDGRGVLGRQPALSATCAVAVEVNAAGMAPLFESSSGSDAIAA